MALTTTYHIQVITTVEMSGRCNERVASMLMSVESVRLHYCLHVDDVGQRVPVGSDIASCAPALAQLGAPSVDKPCQLIA